MIFGVYSLAAMAGAVGDVGAGAAAPAVVAGVAPPAAAADAAPAAAAVVAGMVVPIADTAAVRIAALRAEKGRLAAERKRNASDLRSEEKKRQRNIKAARNLSKDDLMEVLGARAVAEAKGKGKGKAA